MPPEESPAAKFDRLKKQLQNSVLRDYPNPERKGCLAGNVLRELSARPLEEAIEDDPHWPHVTHCSECYRQFLAFNSDFRERASARRIMMRWGLVGATAVVMGIGVFFVSRQNAVDPPRPQNAELAYAKQVVDVPSMSRSGASGAPKPIVLDRKPVELTIQLPVGSKAGAYEFQLRQKDEPVITTSSEAVIRNGTTGFTVKLDLTRREPGTYSMYVRRLPWDWNYYPVEIR